MRRGFTLLPSLWLIVVLSGIVMLEGARSLDALRGSRNRIAMAAAEWARNACLSTLRSQLARAQADGALEHAVRARLLPRTTLQVADVEVDGGAHCTARFVDLGAAVNVNAADSALLACILRDAAQAMKLLAARPIPNEQALDLVLTDSPATSAAIGMLAVRGPHRFNINSAPLHLLECLDEVGKHGAMILARARNAGHEFQTVAEFLDQLAGLASNAAVSPERLTSFPPEGAVVIDGYAGAPTVKSTLILTVRLRGTDLDILRVEEQ
jgi:type II secretory pathway component PulK